MIDFAKHAYNADPIAASLVAVALALTALGVMLRRGGPTEGFIVEVFATMAAICTVLTFGRWLGDPAAAAPNGTDYVLAVGVGTAVLFMLVRGLGLSFSGDEGEPSLLGRILMGLGYADKLPPWAKRLLGLRNIKEQPISEEGAKPPLEPPNHPK